MKRMNLPLKKEELSGLRAGDEVLLTGELFVARDAAHKRMKETLDAGADLPFPIDGATIYYMGPSPARPGRVIGSAGPTTAGRMDVYTPELLDRGLLGMVGKGRRTAEVKAAITRNGAVYFAAVGGAGALLSKRIESSEVLAYEDLGAEALRRLEVKDFPVIVAIDSAGNDIYEQQV